MTRFRPGGVLTGRISEEGLEGIDAVFGDMKVVHRTDSLEGDSRQEDVARIVLDQEDFRSLVVHSPGLWKG